MLDLACSVRLGLLTSLNPANVLLTRSPDPNDQALNFATSKSWTAQPPRLYQPELLGVRDGLELVHGRASLRGSLHALEVALGGLVQVVVCMNGLDASILVLALFSQDMRPIQEKDPHSTLSVRAILHRQMLRFRSTRTGKPTLHTDV